MEFHSYCNLGDYLSLSPLPSKFLWFNRRKNKVTKRIKQTSHGYWEKAPSEIMDVIEELVSKRIKQTSNGYWEEAPGDIMEVIVERLCISDRIRMSIVCKYWEAIALQKHIPTTPQIPWLTLPHVKNSRHLSFFDMSAGKLHKLKLPKRLQGAICCGSSKGWLLMAKDCPSLRWDKLANYCNGVIQATIPSLGHALSLSPTPESEIFLFNPISREVHQLPSLFTIPGYQQFLREDEQNEHNISCFARGIVLSSANISECIVAGAFDPCDPTPIMVAICRPGDKQWSIFSRKGEDTDFIFVDFLFTKRTLHVISSVEHFENYNLELAGCEVNLNIIPCLHIEPEDVTLEIGLMANDFFLLSKNSSNLYLVESASNEILVIKRIYDEFHRMDQDDGIPLDCYETSSFHVYKMDPGTGQWHRLNNIDGQVLFIGYGGSLSLSAKDCPGIQGNCIYFTEDAHYCCEDPGPILSRDCGVFYLQDGRIERSFPGVKFPSPSRISWFTPTL